MSTSGSSVGQVQGPHFVPLGMALTPRGLLKRHKLPTAAHLHTPTPPPGLDLSRPLLLYNTYNSTKVRGVSLRPGKGGGLIPQGPSIVIPDSYTGWFAIMTSDGHTASCYSTVEQITSSKANFFLTRYDVPSYTKTENKDGTFSYQKSVVQSGHVLKLLGIFEDLNAHRHTNSTGRSHDSSSSSSVFSCDKYAQCLNYRNEVVFLPFSASGRFYTTAHKNSKNPKHVYLMAHILKNHRLPVTVRLVCGYMPRVPCNFTGMLRLEQAQKEAVILACTMTNEAQATLFEIDVSSNFALTPVTEPMFPKSPIFLKTVSYCEDEADAWRRQIKVTHHVTEKRSRSLTRSLSDKFVEPLSNIRPLSLSFLSDHEKRKGRERDSSREGRPPTSKDKSRDFKFKDFRRRENSVEKTKFTYHDNSNGYNSYPLKDSGRENKKADLRKISKQNTYVLQNGKTGKQTEKKTESESSSFMSIRSMDNMDYSRVIDDISPMAATTREEGEEHYAEICSHTLRNNNIHKNDGPLSLPNLSLFQNKRGTEGVSRKYSNSSMNSNSASLKSQSSLQNPVRRVISNSSSDSESKKISGLSPGNKLSNENAYRKERTNKNRLLETFRGKLSNRNTMTEPTCEREFEKDKDDEVCCEDVVKRNKCVLPDFRDVKKKHSVNDKMERNLVDKPNGNLQDGNNSAGNTKSRENVNDVYIIRVVVKDRENIINNNMSTLAKDNSGGCYMKIRGFEAPKDEVRNVIDVNEMSGYNSLC